MFRIELTAESIGDLTNPRKFDQVRVVEAIETQLPHEPTLITRNRKRLRPNQLAEWALRIDTFRVFYDVLASDEVVKIIAIGEKIGNDLFISGERYEL